MVSILLHMGVNTDTFDFKGRSVLYIAIRYNKIDVVKLLLSAKMNPNIRNTNGRTALTVVSKNKFDNRLEMTNLLLDFGADPYISDNNNCSPLRWSACYEDEVLTKLFLELGLDPNEQCSKGLLPLQVSVSCKSGDITKLLLEFGADPDIETTCDISARQIAMETEECVELFEAFPKISSLRTLCLRSVRSNGLNISDLPSLLFVWPNEIEEYKIYLARQKS